MFFTFPYLDDFRFHNRASRKIFIFLQQRTMTTGRYFIKKHMTREYDRHSTKQNIHIFPRVCTQSVRNTLH